MLYISKMDSISICLAPSDLHWFFFECFSFTWELEIENCTWNPPFTPCVVVIVCPKLMKFVEESVISTVFVEFAKGKSSLMFSRQELHFNTRLQPISHVCVTLRNHWRKRIHSSSFPMNCSFPKHIANPKSQDNWGNYEGPYDTRHAFKAKPPRSYFSWLFQEKPNTEDYLYANA